MAEWKTPNPSGYINLLFGVCHEIYRGKGILIGPAYHVVDIESHQRWVVFLQRRQWQCHSRSLLIDAPIALAYYTVYIILLCYTRCEYSVYFAPLSTQQSIEAPIACCGLAIAIPMLDL